MFKIGEEAIYIPDDENETTECIIIRMLEYHHWIDSKGKEGYGYCYTIMRDQEELLAAPHELRKKKPPLSTWEELEKAMDGLWNPLKSCV